MMSFHRKYRYSIQW